MGVACALGPGGVPEWPNGTALKAVTGRNVSRGFESRPLCLNTDHGPLTAYRLDRRFVLQAIGLSLLLVGLALVVAMVVDQVWVVLAAWIVAVLMLGRAVLLWLRPPVVARLDADGMTIGGRLTVRPVSVTWTDVQGVSLAGDRLMVDRGGETLLVFPLAYAGVRAHELAREVYDRLNTAYGYRRFDPAEDQ